MPETVSQQEHIPTRTMHDAELLNDGAKFHEKLGHLVLTDEQYDKLHAEMPEQNSQLEQKTEQADAVSTNPEKTQETLSEIVKTSNIGMEVWLGRGVIAGRGGKFETFAVKNSNYGTPEQTIRDYPTKGSKVSELNAAGVSEIATFTELPMKLGEDQLVLMSYEVTNRIWDKNHRGHDGYIKNNYKNGSAFDGATGADLLYGMIMKLDKAKELEELITADPENLHRLTDTVVGEALGGDVDAWHEKGPLYEQWRELSEDGKNRIAIRHDITKSDGPSKILEY